MGRPHEVASLLKAGLDPVQIAARLGISDKSVFDYLHRAVGEGLLRRSDIYFAVPPERRSSYRLLLEPYSDHSAALGDMYLDLRRLEINLHRQIQQSLVVRYGDDEKGWWRQGVPETVRLKCQERREKDPEEPCTAYGYTDLLDLGKIIENQWSLFKDQLPPSYAGNRRTLLDHLARLNRIRNKVMHPVRGVVPCEDDFDFVRGCLRDLRLTKENDATSEGDGEP